MNQPAQKGYISFECIRGMDPISNMFRTVYCKSISNNQEDVDQKDADLAFLATSRYPISIYSFEEVP